jgi:hypothetical protein
VNSASLPTKKLFIISIPILVLLAGGLYAKEKMSSGVNPATVDNIRVLPKSASQVINDVDSDGDGLMDWEEVLWKTDPHNAYSNGKSVPDGEFVKTLVNSSTAKKDFFSTENATDSFSIELFREYWDIKKSGNMTPEVVKSMTERLAGDIFNNPSVVKFTVPQELRFPDNERERAAKYAESVLKLRDNYQNLYLQNQISARELTSPIGNSSVNNAINLYTNLASDLKKMSVPVSMVPVHESLIQSYLQSAEGLRLISKISSDPLRALVGAQMQSESEASSAAAIERIASFLAANST